MANSNIKKSLFLTLEFPPQSGGVATYYYNVCKNLPAETVVVLAPQHLKAESFDIKQSFTIIRDKTLNELMEPSSIKLINKAKQLILLNKIRKIIKDHKIELIQVGNILPLGTLSLFIKQQKKIPYIVYAHGLDILLPQRSAQKKLILKSVIKGAKAIVVNSLFTRNELFDLDAQPDDMIVVHPCPNFTDTHVPEDLVEKFKDEHELKNKKIILTVGRLVERKGIDKVIEALPTVINRLKNVAYLVVGSGPYQENLKMLVNQKKLGDYVTFLGEADDEQLKICFEACDVFVMPSRQIGPDVEGFGIVYLEANLFGKPVIAGKSGGATEAVLNDLTGINVEPEDISQIAGAIIKILTDKQYADRLGFQGMQRALEEFTWAEQTEKIKDLLT